MLFHTSVFALFLIVLIGILLFVRDVFRRRVVLLAASYVFYMWWSPIFVLPLLATTFIDFQVGRMLEGEHNERRRRLLLIFSLTANLGLLGYFKYYGFFVENIRALAAMSGFDFSPSLVKLILPVGISFYTFHTMSYTIDVYRREIPACRSALQFALFITFFPVLIAGPILRARQFLPELRKPIRLQLTPEIVMLAARGLAKKALIADNIGPFVDAIFSDPQAWPSVIIWIATFGFAVQIYCDFSGYSDMARALARLFGYEIPLNFDRPYFARNPSEFWRRWHISLSSWLRDYLYIPLGGSRHGRLATYRNLTITMLLGGLWHGASWNFVLWGFLHGLLLAAHRAWSERNGVTDTQSGPLGNFVSWMFFQYVVLLSWIPFRVSDTSKMIVAMRKFVFFDFDFRLFNLGLASVSFGSTVVILLAFTLVHTLGRMRGDLDTRIARAPLPVAMAICALLAALLVFFWPLAEKPFIYFQF